MNLKKELSRMGYDLITGPVRDQDVLQLWLKKDLNPPVPYKPNIGDLITSDVVLTPEEKPALDINYGHQSEFDFHLGINALSGLLSKLGIAKLDITGNANRGKRVLMSYGGCSTLTVYQGDLVDFIGSGSLKSNSRPTKIDLMKDNMLVISGVYLAADVKVVFETEGDWSANVEGKLSAQADGKASFKLHNQKKLEMTSEGNTPFPIAVMANRLIWDNNGFKKLRPVGDNRNLF